MLIMYTRLTLGLTASRLVYYLAGYVVTCYIVSQIASSPSAYPSPATGLCRHLILNTQH